MPSKTSFLLRALLALVLLVGFYLLALGLSGLLLYIPYAEVAYANRFSPKLAVLCVAGAFGILKGSVFVQRAKFTPPGPEIFEADEPRLFALIREVAGRMHTAMPRRVFLVPDVNAFVAEVGGFMGFGSERIMGIGVGMLAIDSVSEFKATIAHEFGHYTGGDTKLGGIVYRTRAAIGGVLQSLGGGALSKPFEWYGKLFLRISHGVSRAQELAADRASVAIAGKQAHIRGLTHEARGAVLFQRFLVSEVQPVLEAGFRPDNLYAGFRDYTKAIESRGDLPNLEALLHEQATDPYDTHPALPDRIAYANSLSGGPEHEDGRCAMDLLDHAAKLQEDITERLATRFAGQERALVMVGWEQVSARVHEPKLSQEAQECVSIVARMFGGEATPRGALRTLVAQVEQANIREVAKKIEPRVAGAPSEVAEKVCTFVVSRCLGAILGAALVEQGGSWTSPVGAPHSVSLGGELLEPFKLAGEAVEQREKRTPLLALAQA